METSGTTETTTSGTTTSDVAGAPPALDNGHLRVRPLREGDAYVGYSLDVRRGEGWVPLGAGGFGRLVHRAEAGDRREVAIRPTGLDATGAALTFTARFDDADGVAWRVEHRLALLPDERQVLVACEATPAAARQVLHWGGPTFRAGEGAFGARKAEALFPGLEYLLDDEPSSGTAFAAEALADRSVPHPYKVAVPLMAVADDGVAVGLLWDPNQAYGSAWRHPSAVFSSPNRVEGDGRANHLMGLFAPSGPRWVAENALEAHRPFGAGPATPLRLEARLVALADAGAIDVLKVWVETYGLPRLDPPHAYRDNVELCVRSYLDVAWDPEARGWHHTLADPWGPRYEPRVIAQLHRYGQWPEGDPALRARAREQVRLGLARAAERAGEDGGTEVSAGRRSPVPHLELALHHRGVVESLAGLRAQAAGLIAEQSADGSWPWRAELIQVAAFDTEERRAVMGSATDSSTGLTAERAVRVLTWARISGDRAAREAGLRAVDWCNRQRRPEGAQTWELHLHVPDVLAVPHLVDVNLEAHALTGDPAFLAAADRWAWTGLPFTYLWRALYRPIMAYGTVPVFGVTFHDVQSWFGVDVHWNGLVYADALFRLAAATGEARWRTLAEGIVACGMQQQPTDGPWLGMYPDAYSPVHGDEEYTWWLNPNLIGLNTFELAGIPLDLATAVVPREPAPLRVTSAGDIAELRLAGGTLSLLVGYPAGAASHTVLAGTGRPASVASEGRPLPEAADLDAADHGWHWLDDQGLLLVKLAHGPEGTRGLEVTLA